MSATAAAVSTYMTTIMEAAAVSEAILGDDGSRFSMVHNRLGLAPSRLRKVAGIPAIVSAMANMAATGSTMHRPPKPGIPQIVDDPHKAIGIPCRYANDPSQRISHNAVSAFINAVRIAAVRPRTIVMMTLSMMKASMCLSRPDIPNSDYKHSCTDEHQSSH
jgi:hypothetical protein